MKFTFPIEIIVVKIPYIHGNCIHCKCKLKCWLNREFNEKKTLFLISNEMEGFYYEKISSKHFLKHE